jgi:hypothetical protein
VERRGEPGKRGGGSYWWRLPDGQISIKSATTNTTPVGGVNEDNNAAGQSTDSDPAAINSATPPDGGGPPNRIRLSRAKGWRLPAGAVNVARSSKWGNPHAVGKLCKRCTAAGHVYDRPEDGVVHTREQAIKLFRRELDSEAAQELAGKDLACWCPLDQPCHADVLLEVANG